MSRRRPTNARALARRPLVAGLAVLVGVVFQSGAAHRARLDVVPADQAVRDAAPYLGEPCRNVHNYPVAFVEDRAGTVRTEFSFAGGAARGSLPLPANESRLGGRDAYVTDVQLGSYEPSLPEDPRSPLVCRINPTYHFYCPATDRLDQLCYTWSNPRESSPSRGRTPITVTGVAVFEDLVACSGMHGMSVAGD